MAFSVTFSSKPIFTTLVFHQIISSTFIICAIIVFYRSIRNNILRFSIPTAVVLLRILRLIYGDGNGVLETIYFVPYSILIIGVGTKMFRDYPYLMLRQIKWICAISIILSIMQIMGVQWAQSLTNFYHLLGGSAESYLLVRWSDLPAISGIQVRPVGFAHANNALSQFLLFFYAFSILWFADKKLRFKPPLKWMFIISFACALTGAKLVIAGIVLINITALLIVKPSNKLYLFRVFFTVFISYVCYWFLFPGLFVFNYNFDLFAFSSLLRLASIMHVAEIPYAEKIYSFFSQYQTGDYMGSRSVINTVGISGDDISGMTGLGLIINDLTIIIFTFLLLAPFWLTRLRKLARYPNKLDMHKLPVIMLVAGVASLGGGPFLYSSYFWFFFSFALYPLSVLLLRPFRVESLGHSIPANSFSHSMA